MARFVETSGGIVAGISGRYATALYQLAESSKATDKVAASLAALTAALAESADFKTLISSPLIDRADAGKAVAATAKAMKLDRLTANFLGVLAQSRRLASLPAIITDFGRIAAAARGEVTARVTSAHKLDAKQTAALLAQLKAGLGRDVALELDVNPEILGGLVVRVGSRMIDSSIATKLDTLGQRLKG